MTCRNSIIIQKLCNMYRMTQSNWYVDRQSIVTIIKFLYGYQLSVYVVIEQCNRTIRIMLSWTVCAITREHLNAFFHLEQKTCKPNSIFFNQKGIITFSFFTNRLVQYQALLNRRSLVLFEDLCLEYNLTTCESIKI